MRATNSQSPSATTPALAWPGGYRALRRSGTAQGRRCCCRGVGPGYMGYMHAYVETTPVSA
jgi:hypothetical protein